MKTFCGALVLLAGSAFYCLSCSGGGGNVTNPDTVLKDTVPPILSGFTGPSDTLRFGTLNMCVGFPVSQLVFLRMDLDSVAYPELVWLDSLATIGHPHDRIRHMADAAAAESLDVIALQEVMTYAKNGQPVCDFLPEFLQELQARSGLIYQPYLQRLNDTTLRANWKGDSINVHFSEGNALLIRQGITILDTEQSLYQNHLVIVLPTIKTKTDRGYTYARLQTAKGALLEVYTTHLEVFNPYTPDQAGELKQHILTAKRDHYAQVVLGDFNAEPDSAAYNIVVEDASFFDSFRTLDPSLDATCCLDSSAVWDPTAQFSNERIDFILGKSILAAEGQQVLLDSTFADTLGQQIFATDHRMPIASLILPIYPQ